MLQWKQNEAHKCALMIEGARRVGKSYIVEEFAKYPSFASDGYVLHPGDVKQANGITYLPLYMTPLLTTEALRN